MNECDTVLNQCMTFSYDHFDRLASRNITSGAAQNFSYLYDRWGNRWQQTETSGSGGPQPNLNFNTSSNQITTSGYAYDAAGNMTSDGTHTYTYDAEGNVTKVDNGSTNTFTYDALNQRVRIDWPWQGIEFVYNPAGQHTSSFNAANHAVSADWIFWGGSQFAVYSNNQTLFDHQDWLGTERMRTDAQGNVNGSFQSLPYGDGYTVSGNDWDQYHFAGMDQDTTSNEHAMFRGYSNMAGRWFSPDPYRGSYDFTNPQSLNRYSYVVNSPLSFVDPSGLNCVSEANNVKYSADGGQTWDTWDNSFSTTCEYDPFFDSMGGGGEGGVAPGGGGGAFGPTVTKHYGITIPCTSSATGVMGEVESGFGTYGDYSRLGGLESVTFYPPNAMDTGSTIPINVETFGFSWNVSVNVVAMSTQSMTFTTNPGHVLYPASITFSASLAGPGSINFNIDLTGTVANPLFYLGGGQFENAQWNHFLNQVSSYCQQQ